MSTPVKILYVIDTLHRGGTELQLSGLLRRLDRGRFEASLVTLRGFDPDLVPAGCEHWHLGVGALLHPRGLAKLASLTALLARRRFSIVQTFFQDSTLLGGLAARLAGTPVRLASFRDLGFWRTRRQTATMRLIYRTMTGYIANSAAARDHFCAHDRIDPARVVVIPNGLDAGRFAWTPPRAAPRVVGIVGNLNRQVKRIDLFVAAAGLLRDAFPEVRWEIVGDGGQRDSLVALARRLGVEERITFLGRIAEVPQVIAGWDVGVLCSDSEGFSNALLEYMLAGCAVVATAVGGNREAVDHERTGLLVPAGDARALAAAVGRLLADGALTAALAAAARKEVVARYDWDVCVAAHQEFYLRQVARYGRRG